MSVMTSVGTGPRERPGKESPGGCHVPLPGQQDVDDLAELVDRPVR